ncbi:MAG: succinate dehydrogenase iron-sulfur subunit [Thermoplasmata archaeon]|nr:succinate dehydrogenase iron-sulfur subunit [Thermoplasmata archaeon]
MANDVVLRLTRYRPEQSPLPFHQDFTVPYRDDMMVLDALSYIKDELDGSVAFRWSCRMGICGSCAATVEGNPVLTCETFLHEVKRPIIRVEPLAHFPIIKDLVIDMDGFMEKLQQVKPWIIRGSQKPLAEGEYHQLPEQVEQYRQQSLCINCMICYAGCPVYGLEPEFVGPAALALAYRYNADTRDHGSRERLAGVIGKGGLWECTYVGECSVVCPKNVDPAGAIQRLKAPGAIQAANLLLPPMLRR